MRRISHAPFALSVVVSLSALSTFIAVGGACGGSEDPPIKSPVTTVASTTTLKTATPIEPVVATKIDRVVVSFGRKTGTCVTTKTGDILKVSLEVLENGRGPKVDATIKLAADGTIQAFDAKGHHTMGTPVDETFVRDGDHARWKSPEETGDREVKGAAFFLPIADMPEAIGLLTEALLRAKAPLPLLPGGTASLEKIAETDVKVGDQTKHLVGYALVGVDFNPLPVWMNSDGTFFGIVSPWWSVVPAGTEGAIDPLVVVQQKFIHEREARIAKETAHKPPAAGLAYTHARVLDVEHGKWLADQTVVVVGDVIHSVGPSAKAKLPAGAEVVDLAGKALLPGLWDMHSHMGDADGALDIASGVTTARDVGNDPDELDDRKKRYDEGSAVGPRVLRFGFIEGRNEKAASSKVTAETEAEAKAAVAFFEKRGYEGIKIYNSVKPELVPILTKEAHAKKMMVTGHIPVHMLAHEAVDAGYDGIEHINMLFLNFFATHDTDTRDTTRFTLVGEKGAGLDLKSKPVVDFIAQLKKHDTVIDPTLNAFEDLFVGQQGKISPGLESMVARLPAQTQRWFLVGGLPLDEAKTKAYLGAWDKLGAMVKTLADAKVQVVTGTDSFGGLTLHHELALFVRAGITPAAALRMATLDSARSMKLEKKTGSITAGKAADLFIVDGDPLAKIDDVGKVVSTMRAGVVYPSAALYATVGVKPM